MEIICPECQFARQVDESKIPARSQMATCPKCKTKFKFRELPDEEFDLGQPEPQAPASETPAPATQAAPSSVDNVQQDSPDAQEPQTTFPPLEDPAHKPEEGLWDSLGGMTPPQEQPREENIPPQASEPIPGWTGEFNADFPDPMQQSDEQDEDLSGPSVPPPFEQLDRYGFFHGLYMTLKLILLSPRLFFAAMPVGGGFAKPLTFTILITMIQSLAQYFWGMAGLSTSLSGEVPIDGVSGSAAAILMLLLMPAFLAIGQFLLTGLYHILLVLMRAGDQGFEGTFRALAYANAPIILGIFPMPMHELEIGWTAMTAIWGLFLTITGLKLIHKTSYSKVIPVALIPLLLGMIFAMLMLTGPMTTV